MGIDSNIGDIAKVVSLEVDGIDHIEHYLNNLTKDATENLDSKIKKEFLLMAFDKLQFIPLDLLRPKFSSSFLIEVEGVEYKKDLILVKPLKKEPIFELRLSIEILSWHFRATFFPKIYEDKLYYCLVFPFEKKLNETDPTDTFRDKTFSIYEDTNENPEDYLLID